MKTTLPLLIFSCLTLSCSKRKAIVPIDKLENEQNSKLELIWEKPMSNGSIREFLSIVPKVYQNKVLFSSDEMSSRASSLILMDGRTGNTVWQWDHFIRNPSLGIYSNHLVGDKFFYHDNYETGVIDMKTGSTEWQHIVPNLSSHPRLTVRRNYIYTKHASENGGLRPPEVYLVRSPVSHPDWDTIFVLKNKDNSMISIEGPSSWIDPNGDEILVYQERSYNTERWEGEIDFYAFNISADSIKFILRDIEPSGNSNVIAPLIDGNYAYFLGARSVTCIDLIQGQIVWQNLFYGDGAHLLFSNLLIVNDKLIIKQDHNILQAVNKMDGNTIWVQNNSGYTPSPMVYHDGIIYYTANGEGKLMAIDAINGAAIWNEKSPHEYYGSPHEAAFNGGVAIDPELEHIYVSDYYYAMCFKLPNRP